MKVNLFNRNIKECQYKNKCVKLLNRKINQNKQYKNHKMQLQNKNK